LKLEEGSLDSLTRRAKERREEKKPRHSARDDSFALR